MLNASNRNSDIIKTTLKLTSSDKQTQLDSVLLLYHVPPIEVKSNNEKILSIYDWRGLFLLMCAWYRPRPCIWYFPEIMFPIGSADWRCITVLPGGKEIPCRFFPLENVWSVFPYVPCTLSRYGSSLTGLLSLKAGMWHFDRTLECLSIALVVP